MILPPPPESKKKVRKHLSADALYALVGDSFAQVPDPRRPGSPIPLSDALLSAFALFALKNPSLLAFDHRRSDENLKTLFGIGQIPSDTGMREILDPLDPEHLRPVFGDVFRQLQRGKALEPFVFYAGAYLLSLDGTGYFSSPTVHCESCQVKEHKDGSVTYQHQMLGAVICHPDIKEVIPLAPEPIQKQDGASKNDCERNAAKRLLPKIRQQHPHLKFIVIEDGLSSNGPHLRDLIDNEMHFILGVKPGDHAFLFEQVEAARRRGRSPKLSRKEEDITAEVSWVYGVPLNESNPDLRVDFLEYNEYDADGKRLKHFTWITDLHINLRNAWLFARGGRARWRIENENLQYVEEPGLSLRAQLRAWTAQPVGGVCHVDDVGILGRPGPTTLLSAVSGGVEEAGEQARVVGEGAFSVLVFPHWVDASTLRGILYDLAKQVPLPGLDTS